MYGPQQRVDLIEKAVGSCVRQVLQKGLVMLGAGGAEPPCSAAPSAPGRRQAAKARKASFLCSWR